MQEDRQVLDWVRSLLERTTSARRADPLQDLWGGYGRLYRVEMSDAAAAPVVVKLIAAPPGGSGLAHRRKLRSYEVERLWYRVYSKRCGTGCRVPVFLGDIVLGQMALLALEDLDAVGYPRRGRCDDDRAIDACLAWLANFHATFVGQPPEGLWPVGSYWHLETRPEELRRMSDRRLRDIAPELDARLNACRFSTLVHGDAKPDNFCLSPSGDAVAAVDFQYVGGGCGIKDVVYLLDCVLDAEALHTQAPRWLDRYFARLRAALTGRGAEVDAGALEAEWRSLYPLAWADLYRFLSGWAPGLARPRYVDDMIRAALRSL